MKLGLTRAGLGHGEDWDGIFEPSDVSRFELLEGPTLGRKVRCRVLGDDKFTGAGNLGQPSHQVDQRSEVVALARDHLAVSDGTPGRREQRIARHGTADLKGDLTR